MCLTCSRNFSRGVASGGLHLLLVLKFLLLRFDISLLHFEIFYYYVLKFLLLTCFETVSSNAF